MPEKNCDCPNGGKRKRGTPQKRRTDEAEAEPEIKGSKQFAYGGQRPEGLEEGCVGRRGQQQTAMHETEKEDSESLLSHNTAV
jgi:hypothetical protein